MSETDPTGFAYRLSPPPRRPRLGLIVLQTDETVEQDFPRLVAPQTAVLHVSRVPSGAAVTVDMIAEMERALPQAASLLPAPVTFGAVGYACTSGTGLIGAARVEALVKSATRARHVTNPLTASVAAFARLGLGRIAFVSPYIAEVSTPLAEAFERAGLEIRKRLSFCERTEAQVARIDPASVYAAALEAGRAADVEAVFLSCTNLRTLDVIDSAEAVLGKPVVSSNQALAWHMATLAGAGLAPDAPGGLMRA